MVGQRTQRRVRAKVAACDPCRFAKLACDHTRPTCDRCRRKQTASDCTYRTRPFKKKQPVQRESQEEVQETRLPNQQTIDSHEDTNTHSRHYPNPGYLGSSSHTTIFRQLSPVLHIETDNVPAAPNVNSRQNLEPSIEDDQIIQGTKLVEDILQTAHIASCHALIDDWITNGGVNLALAGSLVKACAHSAEHALTQPDGSTQMFSGLSKQLFVNSCKSIIVNQDTSLGDFLSNLCQENIRWETVGLFFTAVSRATIVVVQFPPLFRTDQQRRALRRISMRYADRCLDLALSLDCLNDLQLMLQYENFINHAYVDGDQSYHSWKRLGDVISSVFALGYHEKINADGSCPKFLQHLRQAVVARIYSADKNMSIFLGRPPRMDSKYCSFDFVDRLGMANDNNDSPAVRYFGWDPDGDFDYMADTWWSFECALLKEETMNLQYEVDFCQKAHKASEIKRRAEKQWMLLPQKYHYSGDLKLYHCNPVERDFVASARLNYLHVLFLLRLQLVRHASEQDDELLGISAEVLHIVAQAAVMKDRLSFSGTGLIWKICHYGMPPTGILCLCLLKQPSLRHRSGPSHATIIQDLSVLVAQVNTGVLIDSSDPNYALLSAATRTIQAILSNTLSGHIAPTAMQQQPELQSNILAEGGDTNWLPWSSNDNWDFELDFWTNLVEHPTLIADETVN